MKKNCPHCGGVNEDVQFCVNCNADISALFSAEAIERKKQEEQRLALEQEEQARQEAIRRQEEAEQQAIRRQEEAEQEAIRRQEETEQQAIRRQEEADRRAEEKAEQRKELWSSLQAREQEEILSDELFNLWRTPAVIFMLDCISILFPLLGVLLGTLILLAPMFESKPVGAKCIRVSAKAFAVYFVIGVVVAMIALFGAIMGML